MQHHSALEQILSQTKNVKLKITPAVARDSPLPETGSYILWDTATKHLGLRIHAGGAKVWIVQKKLGKSPCRYSLGAFPGMTYAKACSEVAQVVAKISAGIDPNLEKRQQIRKVQHARQQESFTVARVFEEYVADKKASAKPPKPSTILDWERSLSRIKAGSLASTPLAELTGGLLADYYDSSAKKAKRLTTNGGRTQAGRDLRYLRAAYALCELKFKLDLPATNPFKELNQLRVGWYLVKARTRLIGTAEGDLQKWWSAVEDLRVQSTNTGARNTIADYLQLSLLWGLRRGELLPLKWDSVDLDVGVVTIHASNTKSNREHIIPITRYAHQLLSKRRSENNESEEPSEWVFQSHRTNKNGVRTHIVETKKAVKDVIAASGVEFSPHDIRRSFGTLFNELGVSDFSVKRALNHAPHDTASKHYVLSRMKTLRPIYQEYENKILTEADAITETHPVVEVSADEYAQFNEWKNKQQQSN